MTDDVELREQDKWLPIANVYRIMKNALPKNAKVSKEAKECVQECVSEFVSFITSEASEKCSAEKRKTVNGEDVLFAMASLGFENYAEVLKIYLTKYREYQNSRDRAKRVATGSNGALLNDDDVKDEVGAGSVSSLGDMSSLGGLNQVSDTTPHIPAEDVDILQSDQVRVSKADNEARITDGDIPRHDSEVELDSAAADSDGAGSPRNIVDYPEETMYEDFQID